MIFGMTFERIMLYFWFIFERVDLLKKDKPRIFFNLRRCSFNPLK